MSEENLRTPKQPSISTANSPLSSGSKCKQSSPALTVTPTTLAYSQSFIAKNLVPAAMRCASWSPGNECPEPPQCSPATGRQNSVSYVDSVYVQALCDQSDGGVESLASLRGPAINRSIEATPLVLSIDAVDENGTMVTANVNVSLSLSRSGLVNLKPVCVRLNGNQIWREKK
uniref:Uncharacterized protein n=1 Tax=Ditylenchus dipsaci TaxID=166011 RepID=A0A915DJA3_9BILA